MADLHVAQVNVESIGPGEQCTIRLDTEPNGEVALVNLPDNFKEALQAWLDGGS